MRKYTISDLDAFEREEQGWLICPSGDYTKIKEFPEKCSFGKGCNFRRRSNFGAMCGFGDGCIFGEMCNFGKGCNHEGLTNSIYVAIDRIGSELLDSQWKEVK